MFYLYKVSFFKQVSRKNVSQKVDHVPASLTYLVSSPSDIRVSLTTHAPWLETSQVKLSHGVLLILMMMVIMCQVKAIGEIVDQTAHCLLLLVSKVDDGLMKL